MVIESDEALTELALAVGERLLRERLRLATAESCTGGWISKVATDVAGSSAWFERGFVCYSNEAKMEMLGVSARTLERHGAVSREVAVEMARGATAHRRAGVSVAVTGVAGPGGGTLDKPVGLVWIAWYRSGGVPRTLEARFDGGREAVRRSTVAEALRGLKRLLD
jgi:nicotinamide-nucleotide amidase